MMRTLIRGGRVVDPGNGRDGRFDVLVVDGAVAQVASAIPAEPGDAVVEAAGRFVVPGLVDPHCHLRDPGFEYREDIATGTAAAAAGGFTSVACMPNTNPVCDNAAVVEYIRSKARRVGVVNVYPIGAISRGLAGAELAEIGLMKEAGAVAVSDDGKPVASPDLMRKALQYAAGFGMPVVSHCEEPTLSAGGAMNEGRVSAVLGLRGIPATAEDAMTSRELLLAEYLGVPVHIAHVSTAGSIAMIRAAKARGVQVTCETCPHYFLLTDEACLGFDTMAKVNPPLRTAEDVAAVLAGIADGTVDMLATDHAPHHADEKDLEFALANSGIDGFETAFALSYDRLVGGGVVPLARFVELMSLAPARLLGIGRGTLSVGAPGDVTVFETGGPRTFRRAEMKSKSKNTPFDGWRMNARVVATVVGGTVAYRADAPAEGTA